MLEGRHPDQFLVTGYHSYANVLLPCPPLVRRWHTVTLPPFHLSTHGENHKCQRWVCSQPQNPSQHSSPGRCAGRLALATPAAAFPSNVMTVRCLFRSKPLGLPDYLPSRHWLHTVAFQGFLQIHFIRVYRCFSNWPVWVLSVPLSVLQPPLRICCLQSPLCSDSYPSPWLSLSLTSSKSVGLKVWAPASSISKRPDW